MNVLLYAAFLFLVIGYALSRVCCAPDIEFRDVGLIPTNEINIIMLPCSLTPHPDRPYIERYNNVPDWLKSRFTQTIRAD